MKKIIIVAMLAVTVNAYSQGVKKEVSPEEIVKVQCVNFFVTPPLRELAVEDVENPPMKMGKDRVKREFNINPDFKGEKADKLRQFKKGAAGEANIDVNVFGVNGGFPPDPSGAIGPNHYVQAVNTTWRIYDSEGDGLSFPVSLSTLWDGSSNDGDPIVMYDQFYDRWFISQFQTASNSILIAISKTPDPEEEYYAYEFQLSGFPDYPKFSVWGDAYYMTANSFGNDAVAFERDKMVAGDATASMIALNAPSVPTGNFYSMLPADADGALPPSGTPNYMFHPGDQAWGGNSFDQIRIYEMNINWDNPNSSGIQLAQQLEVENFNANFSNSWNDIEQPESSQKLDAVAGIFTYRAQYRRWIGYNTVILTQVVDVDGADTAGIRWYELRQDDAGGNVSDWYVYQSGTYSPDDTNRWLASASMDDHGNIAMAYSIGGTDMSASLACTGRLRWDPLGEMTVDETIFAEGSGAQEGGNRFGDYSQMTLAPDGETFWFTGEYILSGNRRTRIVSFTINDPLSVENEDASEVESVIYQNGSELMVSLKNLPSVEPIYLELFDFKGAQISSELLVPNRDGLTATVNVSGLAVGAYMVRFGNDNYQSVKKIVLQ
ncbi:MAG TPA: hypothetical protein DHU89_09965 [Flavobacteriales bacterium]|nr:hypothetical protein [Flavobacteriales bacterium]|tara:strand:+ start:17547 stop:19361 length:1815 start_codon:yes stop_codon:yes gene_type:complete